MYTVFQKSDAKIQITLTTAYLIRSKYPINSFNYRLSGTNFANFNKILRTVSEQQLFKTRRSATAKSTARPSCVVGVLYDIYRRQTTDQQLINHLYETGHETYRIPRNNAKQWPLQRSRSFKVTDFGTNRKPVYDFLLAINSNWPSILHHFQVTADYMQNFG